MFRGAQALGYARGRLQFDAMPLPVIERECVDIKALPYGFGHCRCGVQPATQQTHSIHLFIVPAITACATLAK